MPMDSDIRSSNPRAVLDSFASPDRLAAVNPIDALPVTEFLWGAGIECSFLPHLAVDQFKWTQHDRFWRQDLALAKEQLGISHLRYAFPWHVLEPQRGTFDWSYADERMEEFERLGITPLLDV
ncbi:MAG TPA: beta-galactosidase, partial [Tepidisphaeraceae bacterium]|nr:beta-galactosidase [Tepidisphaeraceae bacterium]